MKRIILSLFILAAALQACIYEYGPADEPESADVEVTFTLTLSGASGATRAGTYADPYEDQEGLLEENRIGDLQVYLYDANGNFLKKVDEISFSPITENSKTYSYLGTLKAAELGIEPTEVGGTTYSFTGKVMVLANCPDYTPAEDAGVTLSDANLASFSYAFSPDADLYIPMWGIASVTGIELRPSESADLGDIELLRAMTKIEVTGSEQFINDGFTITSVSMSRYNTGGRCLPSGAETVAQTSAISVEQSMNIADAVVSAENLAFKQGGSWYVYVPESRTSQDNGATYISVTISRNGVAETRNLFFADYDNVNTTVDNVTASTYDLVRNHYWRYEISKEVEIIVDVVVDEWERYDIGGIIM